ncbi:MAG: aminopeptidase [Angelakisella sp.]|jgi:aspartyl aminopeptidase|nr:aminopeptidase [Angelakisella sp.]
MSEKTQGEELREKLFYQPKNLSETMTPEEKAAAEAFAVPYKAFLDRAKTEREAVTTIVEMLEKAGYVPFVPGKQYPAGAKVYLNNRGKALIASTIGTLDIGEGVRIEAAHIDNPRLDLKPNPLVEEQELCFLKTHYYGGIKKYQWTAIPLSLHGVVVKKDGSSVTVTIGEDPDDPVFCVTDLLPHLGADQMKKPMTQGITGEQLNVLIGCEMYPDEKVSEKVKLNILSLLNGKYGITERDFQSAELCAVPAFKARDLGLDRGMVGAYGHDDRVCAFAQLMAEIEAKNPAHTTVTVFADKEEVGSDGVTGLNSHFLVDFIADLAQAGGKELRHVLRASACLSADVSAAFDPAWPEVAEKHNCAYLGYGPVLTKYTGARGKSSTNDAPAEYVAFVEGILEDAGVTWQTGELGKVDQGGGGTVAMYVSQYNVNTVDMGVAVLSMHAPFEVISKADLYMTYKAMAAFYR